MASSLAMQTYVVLFDPRPSPLRLGTLVSNLQIGRLEAAGVVTLPVESFPFDSLHFAESYAFRSFGEQQVVLKSDSPGRVIGMVLEHNRRTPYVHWLVGVSSVGPAARGEFSLLSDTGPTGLLHAGSISSSKAVLEPGELPLPGDSVVLGGRAKVTASEGLLGITLHARANDVSVLWCAVSQCSEERLLGAIG